MSRRRKHRPPPPTIRAPVVDSHCHLEPEAYGGEEALEGVIERAWHGGLRALVAIGAGYGTGSARQAVEMAQRHPDRIRATVGLHPHHARLADRALWRELRALAETPWVTAVGETGLDFHYDRSPRAVQRRVLEEHAALAAALDLPLVIHDRESGGEALRVLERAGAFLGPGVLFHCFSGGPEELEQVLSAGAWISLPGIVTFPKATAMHEVARRVPLSRLMVETDAPFLAPVPWRGRRNEPAHVRYTVAHVARLRDADPESVAEATAHNAARFFQLPGFPVS